MTEQQPYELLQTYADFELRLYPAHTVAEVEVRASFERAGNAGFRPLFNYISGENRARRSLDMTAPVVQGVPRSGAASSEKVRMTAPVVQRGPVDGGLREGTEASEDYAIAFVLPAGMTEDLAPIPTDPRVRIRSVPASIAAVLQFSGRGSESAFAKRAQELREAIIAAGMTPSGPPRFAQFDPPFKPWFLRHNEVVQDVEQGPPAGLA